MDHIIKEIMSIIKPKEDAVLQVYISNCDDMVFTVYDSEIDIIVNFKTNKVYVETSGYVKINSNMLYELHLITNLLETKISVLKNLRE